MPKPVRLALVLLAFAQFYGEVQVSVWGVGQPVSVHLTNGGEGSSSAPSSSGTPAPTPVVAAYTDDQDERDHIDVSELEDATDVSTSGVDKLVQAFPGAELIEQETP